MDTRLILIPFILVILAVVEVDNRNFLFRNFAAEDLKGYHSPLAALVACVVIFVAFMFLFPGHNDEYKELQEKYDELSLSVESYQDEYDDLQSQYDDLSASVNAAYDEAVSVKAYFLGWEDASFEDAKQSMNNLYDQLFPGEW